MSPSVVARVRAKAGGVAEPTGESFGLAWRRFFSARAICTLAAVACLAVVATHSALAQADLAITTISSPARMTVCTTGQVIVVIGNSSPSNIPNVSLVVTGAPNQELIAVTSSLALNITTQSVSPPILVFDYGPLAFGEFRTALITVHAIAIGIAPMSFLANPVAGDSSPANNAMNRVILQFLPATGTHDAGTRAIQGEPVSTFSGKEVLTESPDLDLGGPLPVFFQRHHDGALVEDGVVNSTLGPNWQHNYDIRLAVAGTNATVAFRQGRVIAFEHDGAAWRLSLGGRIDIGFRLAEAGGEFVLADPRSQLMYFFDGGLLKRIEDGRGNTNFLSYSSTLLTNINDGLGRQLTLRYDGANQLTNVSDGIRSVGFIHGSPLASVVDALGFVTSYSYTTNTNNPALLTARTLPEGNSLVTNVYDATGRVVTQVDAAGNTNTFAYLPNPAGGLTNMMTDPLGHTLRHVYNGFGELTRLIDEAGSNIVLSVDAAGRRSFVIDRILNGTSLIYDADTGLPTQISQPGGVTDRFTYSNRTVNGVVFKDLVTAARPDNRTNRFIYDANGNLLQYFLRDGASFRYAHNSRGQVTSATNPVGGTATFTYDANARLASLTDSDVGVTTFQYDSLHRLTNVIHPDASNLRATFDALDRVTSATDERGNATSFAYDRNSRLTNVTDALNQNARFEYDGLNRLIRAQDRLGNSTHFSYDPRGQLAAVTNRNGFVTRHEYDARHRRTATVNPGGKTNRFGYDAEGRLTSINNPQNQTVTFTRDAMGYVTGVRNALSNSVGLQLDAMKRVIGFTNALGRKTTNTYTARGQLSGVILPGGITSSNQYDALGSLTNLIDPNNRNWNFAYTPMGRLSRFIDPLNRTNTYAYDTRGRLARVTYPDGVTLTNTYDAANNLTRLQYSDGTDLQFAYDPLDRLTNATGSDPISFSHDAMSRITNTRQIGLNFGAAYDADGRLTSVTYSNGLFTVTYAYDSRNRLTSVSDNLTGTTLTFTYDDADRLTGITRPNGVNTTYTYDAAGRLTRIQDGSIVDIQYTLDANGNVTEADYVTAPIDPTTVLTNETASLAYDNASQISTAGYAYDPRGRVTNMPNAALKWDGASRLITISNVNLGYNALGDLATRVEGGNTNRFFYNYAVGLNPIMAERNDNTSQFTRFYVWSPGGSLLYIINLPGNTVSFPHFDRVGSTLALTGAGGTVTDSYAYDPYGRLLSRTGTSTQPFRFNGAFGIRTDGPLHHMRARWYYPNSIRFLSKEPIWPALAFPQRLNAYAFANQNPLIFADPLGDEPVTLTVGGFFVASVATVAIGASIGKIIADHLPNWKEEQRQKDLEKKRKRLLRDYNNLRSSERLDEPPDAAPSAPPQPPGAPDAVPQPPPGAAQSEEGDSPKQQSPKPDTIANDALKAQATDSAGPQPVPDEASDLVYLCFRGRTIQVPKYLTPRYLAAGAQIGPCPETSPIPLDPGPAPRGGSIIVDPRPGSGDPGPRIGYPPDLFSMPYLDPNRP